MAKEILIADSDKSDQEEFRKIFGATDYRLIFSESGEDALIRAKLLKPDMIIASGAGLHEMGGLELCGALKGDPEFKHVPFILVSSIFDDISDKDREHLQADGVISKPLSENEVLNLVDHLVEEEGVRRKGKMVSEKPGDFLSDDTGEGEDEIIELVDVVGEPEPKMSIENFVPPEKEKSFGEMTSLDSWEKLEFEEKPLEKEPSPRLQKQREEMNFQLRRIPAAGTPPEADFFEKIELEEILEKVERLKPSLEQEWPSEKEVRYVEEKPSKREEPSEKYQDLPTFAEPRQKEARTEFPEEGQQPVSVVEPEERALEEIFSVEEPELPVEEEEVRPLPEEPKKKIPAKAVPVEELAEEEELKELPEEEFLEEFLEEMLGEEEIGGVEKPKGVKSEEIEVEEIQFEALEAPRILREETKPLVREMSRQVQEGSPLVKVVDKHLEEIIAKGIQDMVGDFITKVLPMMTEHIIGLTAERIEKMVKEIVPDLAERAIQEEIKRLQKGEEKE
ncbi:MAG TPA: response regulator [Thermodesulfobacteriota bacterium]|nr:response regulator [Thermodesulfobacteriota bacterium]